MNITHKLKQTPQALGNLDLKHFYKGKEINAFYILLLYFLYVHKHSVLIVHQTVTSSWKQAQLHSGLDIQSRTQLQINESSFIKGTSYSLLIYAVYTELWDFTYIGSMY